MAAGKAPIVRVHSDGKVTVFAGSHSHGQGHDITFAQIAADRLGIDDRRYPTGRGRHRPDPLRQRHVGRALDFGRRHGDLPGFGQSHRQGQPFCRRSAGMRRGRYRLSPRTLWRARDRRARSVSPRSPTSPIMAPSFRPMDRWSRGWRSPNSTIRPTPTIRRRCISPSSSSMPDTGAVTLRAISAADDCGEIINPMIVEGQVHGGIAQGIGQALMRTDRL